MRQVYRKADTLGERLERRLRVLYLRKTVPRSSRELESMVQMYYAYRNQVRDLERALSDYYSYVAAITG